MPEPLPARVPVQTATGRTGVIVDVSKPRWVVEHPGGDTAEYWPGQLHYAAPEPGALYLSAMQFEDVLRGLR